MLVRLSYGALASRSKEEIFAGANAAGCVVLLHGLARTSGSMAEMAEALRAAGYVVVNVDMR